MYNIFKMKTKEQILLEELRRQRDIADGKDGEEVEVEEKIITADDCIPSENIGNAMSPNCDQAVKYIFKVKM